jgi:tetratricopeptide (TPR) repeat protein
MGKTFWAVHHYCWALIHLQRAARPGLPKQDRDHMTRVAIHDFYYVINEAKRNGEDQFVLLPELFYRSGEAYVQLGEFPQAMAEFELSRQAKADYWPPYVAQAQLHARLGMRSHARDLLEAGLRLMPNEVALQDAMKKLGAVGADPRKPQAVSPRVQAAGSAPAPVAR